MSTATGPELVSRHTASSAALVRKWEPYLTKKVRQAARLYPWLASDLESDAKFQLWQAAVKYLNSDSRDQFSTWAMKSIKWSVIRTLEANLRHPAPRGAKPPHECDQRGVEACDGPTSAPDHRHHDEAGLADDVRDLLAGLDPDERAAVVGIHMLGRDHGEVAAEMGLRERGRHAGARAARLAERGLRKLRARYGVYEGAIRQAVAGQYPPGVRKHPKCSNRWIARYVMMKRQWHAGLYDTPGEAAAVSAVMRGLSLDVFNGVADWLAGEGAKPAPRPTGPSGGKAVSPAPRSAGGRSLGAWGRTADLILGQVRRRATATPTEVWAALTRAGETVPVDRIRNRMADMAARGHLVRVAKGEYRLPTPEPAALRA